MARLAMLLYGVGSYVIFLFSLLYLVGFVGDLIVPRSVNRTPPAELTRAVVTNTLLLLAFGVQHTVMARRAFKQRWTQLVPPAAERSTFVLVTCIILALLYTQWRAIPHVVWQIDAPAARIAMHAVFAAGWAIVLLSSFLIDHFDLFGLRQTWAYWIGRPYTPPVFQVHSLYRWVRHPLMLGFLLALWAAPTMTAGRLLLAGVLTTYILIAIQIEERDLLATHGQAYADYRRSTSMILPIPGLRRTSAAPESRRPHELPES